jgi:hypothetical protein
MVRSPRNRWSKWTIGLMLLLQRIFVGQMRLDAPGPATLGWFSLLKAARWRAAESHLGMCPLDEWEHEVNVDGIGRSSARGW